MFLMFFWIAVTTVSYAQETTIEMRPPQTLSPSEQLANTPIKKTRNTIIYGAISESSGSMIDTEPTIEESQILNSDFVNSLKNNLYRKIGDWRIYYVTDSQDWLGCYGQLNDPTLPLRIISDGKEWAIAFADETNEPVQGSIIIDSNIDTFEAAPSGDGWAMISVSNNFVNKMKTALNLSLIPDGFGEISYHLSSFSIPLNIVETCVKNQGNFIESDLFKPIAPTFNAIGGGAAEYGGYNIVGKGESKEYSYAIARGWKVYSALHKNRFAYCVGTHSFPGGGEVRLGYDNAQWQIALPVNSKKNWEGFLGIDGEFRYASGTAAGNWTIAWLGLPDLNKLKSGNQAIFDYGRANYDFPLIGSAAAIAKVKECVQRAGIVPEK